MMTTKLAIISLAAEFMRGAKDAGNDVEMIKVREMDLKFCRGCFACQKTKKCVIKYI